MAAVSRWRSGPQRRTTLEIDGRARGRDERARWEERRTTRPPEDGPALGATIDQDTGIGQDLG